MKKVWNNTSITKILKKYEDLEKSHPEFKPTDSDNEKLISI